jgi:2-amino-4-hydroxy-6-hydroxymethyldihydropteridine diphosphokinase
MQIAHIGLGGNLASWAGAPEATLTAAAYRLGSLGRVVRRSSLYSTAPVGFADQPRFVNAVVALETELAPLVLLAGLLAIEQEFGRERTAGLQNGPRTLDLDILLIGDLTINEPELEIPHPRLAERAFVLIPLNEIAPQVVVPGHARTVQQLLASLRLDSNAVVPVINEVWSTRPLIAIKLR